MVDKKSPVMRQTVAKSTRAPQSKKLNLDKLLTSIKNISTRYKRNGKMTGGDKDPNIEAAIKEIVKFFNKNNASILGSDTPLYKTFEQIDKIKDEPKKKDALLASIKELTGKNNDSLSEYINDNDNDKKLGIKKKDEARLNYFVVNNAPPSITNTSAAKKSDLSKSDLSKALAYIQIFKLAHILAGIKTELVQYNNTEN
jgi:hypothetical protein